MGILKFEKFSSMDKMLEVFYEDFLKLIYQISTKYCIRASLHLDNYEIYNTVDQLYKTLNLLEKYETKISICIYKVNCVFYYFI